MNRGSSSLALILTLVLLQAPAANAQTAPTPCAAPGVSFWSLLDSVGIGNADGRLNLGRLYAICLPQPSRASASNYPYDPDGGGKLTTVVKTADGRALNTFVWYAERIGGLWEMSRYKVVGGHQAVKPLAAGSYLLEFAVEDKPFYRFPFSVVEVKNEDPYQPPGNRYFIEGAWNEYGNVFSQRNDPQSPFRFTMWVQDKSGRPAQRAAVPYEAKIVRARDGKMIGEDTGAFRLQPRWQKADLLFQTVTDGKSAYLKAADVLQEDGRYNVRLTLDGKPYGQYPFTVKGGRIQLQGRQVREGTDPMLYIVDYLSGGRYTSWWLKREAPAR